MTWYSNDRSHPYFASTNFSKKRSAIALKLQGRAINVRTNLPRRERETGWGKLANSDEKQNPGGDESGVFLFLIFPRVSEGEKRESDSSFRGTLVSGILHRAAQCIRRSRERNRVSTYVLSTRENEGIKLEETREREREREKIESRERIRILSRNFAFAVNGQQDRRITRVANKWPEWCPKQFRGNSVSPPLSLRPRGSFEAIPVAVPPFPAGRLESYFRDERYCEP